MRYKDTVIVGVLGDVNFTNWHKGALRHEYFKFSLTNTEAIHIKTQEQVDEFVKIVADYFGVELEPKLTVKKRLDALCAETLTPIVDELNKKHGGGFVRCETEIYNAKRQLVGHLILNGKKRGTFSLNILNTDTDFFETQDYTPIEEVKVKKRFNVVEELCKIELPSMLKMRETTADRVSLWWGQCQIGVVYNGNTGKTATTSVVGGKRKNELNRRFGVTLKPEQGKEYVRFIAEVLDGVYK